MKKIIKRNGDIVDFDKNKIIHAILQAMKETTEGENQLLAKNIADHINNIEEENLEVEQIQDLVEDELMKSNRKDVAKEYIRYRYKRNLVRESNTTDKSILELLNGTNEYWNNENSNKDAKVVTVQRDYLAGITSTDITKRFLLPPDIVKAHTLGILHFHDADYFAQKALNNCGLINLEDMLQNGTVVNGYMIEKPHRLLTAMTIATQIITAVASSQYGGCTITLTHLAPFVRNSYNYHLNRYLKRKINKDTAIKYAKEDLYKEIKDSIQTLNYQINSMSTTNGQSPFLSIFMYLNENKEYKEENALLMVELLKQRIISMKNEVGIYVTQAFPKLLYTLEEDNIKEGTKYWYLTKLASKCTALRFVPDYISEEIMLRDKGDCFPCMGCRSFLTPDRTTKNLSKCNNYIKGHKYYGRFNQGVVTLNLPDISLSSKGDFNEFWKLFNERMELCHKALQYRHNRLKGTLSDVAPILWQHGAYARLKKGEKIDKLLYDGYSTISLGYAGLYECVKYMTGESHTQYNGKEFGLKVMKALNDKCTKWKEEENIDYSLYGSPIESTTYKFAKCLKKRFGIIKGITDKNYITNSYHVPVFEEINPFDKLSLESQFQKLSPGGAISYIECADLTHNTQAVLQVMQFIYNHIMYAELNIKSDYCQKCGYNGEIKIIDDQGELVWECPNCGNRDKDTMNVTRRTCGYIGTNYWNQGRTQEIAERYVHLDDHIAGDDNN
ncbi:MAG: anaerobic ribonucleoside-triphosphate reductase [Bacillota bacterium]|nr:anaerobic ribonucleoside-triphosphate reductase [Bacillota bacterium]